MGERLQRLSRGRYDAREASQTNKSDRPREKGAENVRNDTQLPRRARSGRTDEVLEASERLAIRAV